MEKYRNLKRIKGGSNCNVYLYEIKNSKYVIKISGNEFIDKETGSLIIKDYLRIKNKLSQSGVRVPETKNVYLTSLINADLVIIESYCGISLREILRSNSISISCKVLLVKKCANYVNKFPEDIPLDTNPGNLVIDKGSITFVDFIPPNPWKYSRGSKNREKLSKIFTSLNSQEYKNKKLSYYSNTFRINRLLYHCKNICPSIEKYL